MKPPATLCVTVTADTTAELRTRRDQVGDADMVELRLDTVRDPDVAGALEGRKKPVIVTCRPQSDGGHFKGSEEERRAILSDALALGAEFVDLEWRGSCADLMTQTGGRRVVLSHHDFAGVPSDLGALTRAMLSSGAEVVKVAVMATRLTDNLTLHDIGAATDVPIALIAMGEAGIPSRVLASWMGSCWTYAGHGVAPGQLSAQVMHAQYRFRSIHPQTRLYGVVGKPVSHSLSPAMHNAAFQSLDIDAVYLPLAAENFDDFTSFAGKAGLAGVSVTAPFKIDALKTAKCDSESRKVGALNTLRIDERAWLGRNTDIAGFLAPLIGVVKLSALKATILGAGGAARAVAVALASEGARVSIAARRSEQAQAVAALVGGEIAAWPPDAASWDLLVNTTPAGTAPNIEASPLPDDYAFNSSGIVYDLVYNPQRTAFLDRASRAGCTTIGGLDMLVAQAQAQFEWWTGRRPDGRVMRDAALARLTATEQMNTPDGADSAEDQS